MTTTPSLLRIQPGFAVVAALFFACGWQLRSLFGVDGQPWAYATVFTAALLTLVAVHELGHVLAACLHGHRVVDIRIGAKFGVTSTGEHTDRSLRTIAAAGPAVGTLAALTVLWAAPTGSALWAAAVVALVENVANVMFFFVPGSDGSKLVHGTRCLHSDTPVHTARATPNPAA